MRVCMICDVPEVSLQLKKYLKREGYFVDHIPMESFSPEQKEENHYDFLLLRMDRKNFASALSIVERVKIKNVAPIVIVVGDQLEIEMIDRCYKAGCDDCVKWPYHPKEMVIKMEKLRDQKGRNIHLAPALFYDAAGKTLIRDEEAVKLTRNESLLLELLVHHRGFTVSHERIEQYLGRSMSANALRTTVYRLREKLGAPLVHTATGEGYRIEKE